MSQHESGSLHTLQQRALGPVAIFFFVVTAAGPLAATVASAPMLFIGAGVTAPLVYAGLGVVLLLFAVGYAAMSGHVSSAAGLAAYVETALGRRAGAGFAYLAAFSYATLLIGIYGAFGYSTHYALSSAFSLDVPWWVCSGAALVMVGVLGHRAITLNAKVLGILLACEVSVLVIFDVVSLAEGGDDGISMAAFDPGNLPSAGLGVALLFAAQAFMGFETAAIYGEEAKAPNRSVARAIYGAVITITLFNIVTVWAISVAYGTDSVVGEAHENPAGFALDILSRYLGSMTNDVVALLMVTSFFAAMLGLHNALSRYVMSLGRASALPRVFASTHDQHQTPHVASLAVSILTFVGVGAFWFSGADPFTELFVWNAGLATISVFSLQAATCVAVLVFFSRHQTTSVFKGKVAPGLALVGLLGIIYLAVDNWGLLVDATEGLPTRLPWLLPVIVIVGVVVAVWRGDNLRSLTAPVARASTPDRDSKAQEPETNA